MHHIRIAILFGCLIPVALSSVALSTFFPYGVQNGDTTLPIADDNFEQFDIPNGNVYNFFGTPYSRLFINNNGGISFVQGKNTSKRVILELKKSLFFNK
jgi:hypothetical protein